MSSVEEKYGKKIEYDAQWNGPMENIRFSTDKIWLIVFCIYLIIYIGSASYGFYAGDIRKLAFPADSAGQTCGIDSEVIDKPYLMFLNLRKCVPSNNTDLLHPCLSSTVCISQCPTNNFIYNKTEPADEIKKKLICTADVNLTSISTVAEIDILIFNDKCAKWHLKSKPILNLCIVSEIWKGHENETITEEELKNVNIIIEAGKAFLKKVYSMSKMALHPTAVAILLAIILSVIYVVLLRWLALPFIYAAICMFISFIGVMIYYMTVQYVKTNDIGLLFGIVTCVIFIIITVIAVIYLRKKIHLARLLVEESGRAIMHMSGTLVFPIIPCILYIALVIFTAAFALSLLTITVPNYTIEKLNGGDIDGCKCKDRIENYYNGKICEPADFNNECSLPNGQACKYMSCRLDGGITPGYVSFFHFVNIFGFYWLIFFIHGFEFMVLGGTFGTWYWTLKKENVSKASLSASLARTTRYHLGTVAVGSLILTITQIIRFMLKALQDKLRDGKHQVAAVLVCICSGCFHLLDSFLNFMSYNAYIMCSIHGKSFCKSAKDAFNLLMRNIVKVFIVDTVADWLFFIAKLIITIIITGGTMVYLNYSLPWKDNDDSVPYCVVVIVFILIATFTISSVIFNVQSIAVKTIFLCLLEDIERNDGSVEKPHYMSSKLEELLRK